MCVETAPFLGVFISPLDFLSLHSEYFMTLMSYSDGVTGSHTGYFTGAFLALAQWMMPFPQHFGHRRGETMTITMNGFVLFI